MRNLMINIGAILVVIGILMSVVIPAIKTKVSEVIFARAHVYERSDERNWENQNIDLEEFNNPAKLRLIANFLPGTPYLEEIVRFRVKVAGPKEIILDKKVQVHVGKYIGPKDGLIKISTNVPEFYIPRSGAYTINVSMDEKPDFSLSSVFVTAIHRVEEADTSLRTPGFIAFAFGLVLIFRRKKLDRKQGSKTARTPKPVEKPTETPEKKKIRWGRNADLD